LRRHDWPDKFSINTDVLDTCYRAAEQASAAHAHQLQQQLEAASQAKQQLAQQVCAVDAHSTLANSSQHMVQHRSAANRSAANQTA
jgi:hypothetical protein